MKNDTPPDTAQESLPTPPVHGTVRHPPSVARAELAGASSENTSVGGNVAVVEGRRGLMDEHTST